MANRMTHPNDHYSDYHHDYHWKKRRGPQHTTRDQLLPHGIFSAAAIHRFEPMICMREQNQSQAAKNWYHCEHWGLRNTDADNPNHSPNGDRITYQVTNETATAGKLSLGGVSAS